MSSQWYIVAVSTDQTYHHLYLWLEGHPLSEDNLDMVLREFRDYHARNYTIINAVKL